MKNKSYSQGLKLLHILKRMYKKQKPFEGEFNEELSSLRFLTMGLFGGANISITEDVLDKYLKDEITLQELVEQGEYLNSFTIKQSKEND